MQRLDAKQTASCLPYLQVVDELDRLLKCDDLGHATVPERQVLQLPFDGSLLLMPAFDHDIAIIKLATVHSNNDPSERPAVQADLFVTRVSNGERLLHLDGSVVTAIRTAALSMLAIRSFGKPIRRSPLIIGSGVQARSHLIALHDIFKIDHAYLSSRNRSTADSLRQELAPLGIEVEWTDDPNRVAEGAPLIVAATDSVRPVVPETIGKGTMVVAVGAFKPNMSEVPISLVHRSLAPDSQLIVDNLEGAQKEAGDLLQANIDWTKVRTLRESLRNPKSVTDMTLFKSVGNGLWDLAACRVAVANLGLSS